MTVRALGRLHDAGPDGPETKSRVFGRCAKPQNEEDIVHVPQMLRIGKPFVQLFIPMSFSLLASTKLSGDAYVTVGT